MMYRITKLETFQRLFQNSSYVEKNEVKYIIEKWVKKQKFNT